MQHTFLTLHQLKLSNRSVDNRLPQNGFGTDQTTYQEVSSFPKTTVSSQSTGSSTPVIIFSLVFLLVGCCCTITWLRRQQLQRSRSSSLQQPSTPVVDLLNFNHLKQTSGNLKVPQAEDLDPRTRTALDSLHGELVRLLAGNKAAAVRLLQRTRATYSEKTEQWCYEKVIHDLIRDRQ